MAQQLTLGRLGVAVDLHSPETYQEAISRGERQITLTGGFMSSSLANTRMFRDELASMVDYGSMIAVTWTEDASLDGYYIPAAASVDTVSLTDRGYVPFSITLERLGSEGEVLLQSVITGNVLQNSKGLTKAETKPFHAIPPGAYSYQPGTAVTPTKFTRSSPAGAVQIFWDDSDMLDAAYEVKWGCAPADYYDGAAEITVNGVVRNGLHCPNTPDSWTLSNGLIRMTVPATTASGEMMEVEVYNGSAWEGGATTNAWLSDSVVPSGDLGLDVSRSAITILRNTPEEVIVRLEGPNSQLTYGRNTFDISLRRGSRFFQVIGNASHIAGADLSLWTEVAGLSAGASTVTGATSATHILYAGADTNGNNWFIASASSGGFGFGSSYYVRMDESTPPMHAAVLCILDYASPATGDAEEDLVLQYFGHISETVRAHRR